MKSRNRLKKKSRAQAMVEFALVLPVLLLIVYGLLETGRLIVIYSSIMTASREASRFGSANGITAAGVFPYQDCDGIRKAARRVDVLKAIPADGIKIAFVPDGSAYPEDADDYCFGSIAAVGECTSYPLEVCLLGTGDRFVVEVCGNFEPILPVFLPYTERNCSAGTGIRISDARTILGLITIPAVVPAPSPQLDFDKIASPGSYDSVGDVITYTYRFRNAGTTSLNGPYTVTDDKFGTFTCSGPSPLLPGASFGDQVPYLCQHIYTISLGDLNNGNVINNAFGTALEGITLVVSISQTKTVLAVQTPQLSLDKTVSPAAAGVLGDVVTYTYTLRNSGNVTLSQPYSVTDRIDRDGFVVNVSCAGAPSQLNPGESFNNCKATYAIRQEDLNTGSVTNTATATATFNSLPVTSNPDSATVITTSLLLQITPTPSIVERKNEQITYTYSLKNVGDQPLSAPYAVTDDKITNIVCTQTPATLNPGDTTTCSATYNVTQADLDAGSIVNNASATSNGGGATSNPAIGLVTVKQIPQLVLEITPNPTSATALGQTVTYTYTLQNTGNVVLKKPYTISDDTYTGVDCGAAVSPLNPGASTSCTYPHTITQADLDNGSITNMATATARYGAVSKLVTSNQDSATVITYDAPRLTLTKISDRTEVAGAGHLITYTYRLRNTGDTALTSPYTVNDDKVASVDCSGATSPLDLGEQTTCTGQYVTQPTDVPPPSLVTNHATASAIAGTDPITSNEAVATVTINTTICDVRHGPLLATPSGITMPIWNFSSFDVNIIQIIVDWNRFPSEQRLTAISLEATSLWTGSGATSPTTIILASGPSGAIAPNPADIDGIPLNIQFLQSYIPSGTERLRVYFSPSGCAILDSNLGTQAP